MRQREGGRYSFRSKEMMRECDNEKGVQRSKEAMQKSEGGRESFINNARMRQREGG